MKNEHTNRKRNTIVLLKMHSNKDIIFSYKQVKHDYSLLRTYTVICGRFNRDYLRAQNQGKLAGVCLQRFSSIFETKMYTLDINVVGGYNEELFFDVDKK